MMELLERAQLLKHATPRELRILSKRKLSDQDKAWAAWLVEAVHAWAWALKMVDLPALGAIPDTIAGMFMPGTDSAGAIRDARLRPFSELYRRADLYYRLHWAARQSRLEGRTLGLSETAIAMRRHSVDWIVGVPYEWDDVPLDT